MEIAAQLSVFLENKPSALAEVCSALAEAGVNLRALSVSDTKDHAVVRLVASDAARAREVLERGGALVVETDVICIKIPDAPGEFAGLAKKLAAAGVKIEYAYGSAGVGAPEGLLVLRVDDVERTKRAL